jgi:hypothetical protein
VRQGEQVGRTACEESRIRGKSKSVRDSDSENVRVSGKSRSTSEVVTYLGNLRPRLIHRHDAQANQTQRLHHLSPHDRDCLQAVTEDI